MAKSIKIRPQRQPTKTDDTGLILAAAVDKAQRDFRYFLKFVHTVDEAEPDPKARVKQFPWQESYVRYAAGVMQQEPLLWIPKSRRMIMTWLNAAKLVWSAMHPSYHGFIQTRNEEQADWLIKDRCWFVYENLPDWFKYIAMRGRPVQYKFRKLEFPNGSKIWGVPQGADQFRGYTASEVFIDEAAAMEQLENSLAAILPLREKGCRICLVSSAQPGYFAKVVQQEIEGTVRNPLRGVKEWWLKHGGKVLQIHYTASEFKDPLRKGLPWYSKTIKEFPGGPDDPKWRQEMEIDFSAYQGTLVYDVYRDEFPFVVQPFEIPADAPRWRTMDYGVRNPSCCLWIAELDDEFYVYRELYQNKTSVAELKQLIHEYSRLDNCSYKTTWIDPSTDAVTEASTPSILHLFNSEPFSVQALKGDRTAAGRIFLYELLSDKRLHFFENCANTRREILKYRYDEYGDTVKDKYNPHQGVVKVDDHAMDALKYWANGIRWLYAREKERPRVEARQPNPISLLARIQKNQRLARYIGRKQLPLPTELTHVRY